MDLYSKLVALTFTTTIIITAVIVIITISTNNFSKFLGVPQLDLCHLSILRLSMEA
jgi:hypothetical protein